MGSLSPHIQDRGSRERINFKPSKPLRIRLRAASMVKVESCYQLFA